MWFLNDKMIFSYHHIWGLLLLLVIPLSKDIGAMENRDLEIIDMAGIRFQVIRNGESNRRYLWIHGDEQTARLALLSHIKTHQGHAFFVDGSQREVLFEGGMLDPNRMFSREGATKNLQKFNPLWPKNKMTSVLDRLDDDREEFLKQILPPADGLLIVLHNNLRGYSIHDETLSSDDVSIKKEQDPRDFFLCTNRNDFELLSQTPFNVVLQESVKGKDDGSLSRLAAKRNIRYVNIEVRLGWLSQQRKMLDSLESVLE